jgi:hypothetical protein
MGKRAKTTIPSEKITQEKSEKRETTIILRNLYNNWV